MNKKIIKATLKVIISIAIPEFRKMMKSIAQKLIKSEDDIKKELEKGDGEDET